jgi:hypothetical protein
MFGRKKVVQTTTTIELSDESRQALVALDNDLQAVRELIADVLETSTRILHALTQEITVQIPASVEISELGPEGTEDGIQVFQHEGKRTGKRHASKHKPHQAMAPDDPRRIRGGPFVRRPRHEQVEWLKKEILADGRWHTAIEVARNTAGDEREFRYLRSAVGGRFKEMYDEGLVERRDSDRRGAMYEFRLK